MYNIRNNMITRRSQVQVSFISSESELMNCSKRSYQRIELIKQPFWRILPIAKSYTFLHRLLTRNPLPSIPENLKRPFPSNTCHNQEFLIRSSFQIQLSTSDSWSFHIHCNSGIPKRNCIFSSIARFS